MEMIDIICRIIACISIVLNILFIVRERRRLKKIEEDYKRLEK